MGLSDIGLVGLAVMGENLVLNMLSHGYSVSVYNRTREKTEDFIGGRAAGKKVTGCFSVEDLCASLSRPKKVMLMVKAGAVVDGVIDQIVPYLEAGDIIIDGGNSHFPDTERRMVKLAERGIYYIGAGISGGEEGALTGPSIMPGGAEEAWPAVQGIFQSISARSSDGTPCCSWVGKGGAGHFVKMVHNGIEYGDMQLICEAYFMLKQALGLSADRMHEIFSEWNKAELDSYLIEITADIFSYKDPETGEPLVEKILDTAGQKGTGKWTAVSALDLGVPLTLIGEAVFARCLSAQKEQRVAASREIRGPIPSYSGSVDELVNDIRQALYASKIVSYAQGFSLMLEASTEYGWELNPGEIALLWRGGCIIRSAFLDRIKDAFSRDAALPNLLLDSYFKEEVDKSQDGWRRVVALAATSGIPIPAFSSALSYFDGYRAERLPANLLQAQRDYFGAHTYERIDKQRGEFFHTNWTGRGGTTSSTRYDV